MRSLFLTMQSRLKLVNNGLEILYFADQLSRCICSKRGRPLLKYPKAAPMLFEKAFNVLLFLVIHPTSSRQNVPSRRRLYYKQLLCCISRQKTLMSGPTLSRHNNYGDVPPVAHSAET